MNAIDCQRPLTWAEIDLDAVAHNVRQFKAHIGATTQFMAVVKANAYGHGAVPVAQAAVASGADWLGVHRVIEGIQLRQVELTAPILVLGHTLPAEAADVVRWNLTPTVNTLETAEALSAAAAAQRQRVAVHVKVDTGMGRFGLLPDEVVPFVRQITRLPRLELEGFWTHFAVADEPDNPYTSQQFARYRDAVQRLEDAGFAIPIKHVANSGATIHFPETHLDMVRCGIAFYGLSPSSSIPSVDASPTPAPDAPVKGAPTEWTKIAGGLRPVMTLKSRVVRVRTLPTGASISYGCTYTTPRPTPVALVPAGYGDGYHRLASNRGAVLIHGQRAPIVGRVCMDQFVVDVSAIPDVGQDDEVVLFGQQGAGHISAEEVAQWTETINYEVVTSITPRVARVYLRAGQPVAIHTLTS